MSRWRDGSGTLEGDGRLERLAVVTPAGRDEREQRPARGPGALAVVCVALGGASALLWGGSAATGVAALRGVAVLALAGVAGVVATAGVARRLVGALLAVVGLAQTGFAAGTGAVVALAGGVVLLAAGLFVLVREPRLARLGARYAAPGDRRVTADPDRAAWEALDEGRDPTIGPADAPTDPGDRGRNGRG
jgi:hypothetical protein